MSGANSCLHRDFPSLLEGEDLPRRAHRRPRRRPGEVQQRCARSALRARCGATKKPMTPAAEHHHGTQRNFAPSDAAMRSAYPGRASGSQVLAPSRLLPRRSRISRQARHHGTSKTGRSIGPWSSSLAADQAVQWDARPRSGKNAAFERGGGHAEMVAQHALHHRRAGRASAGDRVNRAGWRARGPASRRARGPPATAPPNKNAAAPVP